jgi:hypothetical protein
MCPLASAHRATLERLAAQGGVFLGLGLGVHEGIATLVVPREEGRRGFAAQITVDALLIHVKLARGVVRPLVSFVSHR